MGDIFPIFGDVWFWYIVGLVLLIGELLAPGIFLLWLALAAGLTGGINSIFGLGWQAELAVFAVLSVLLVLASWNYVMKQRRPKSDQPDLNQRQTGYVGRRTTLLQAISNGRGKVKIDDTVWDVSGPDMAQGTAVVVTGVTGATLEVKAVG
jgi:membrane protein implicated in regulation of membrane protease activity